MRSFFYTSNDYYDRLRVARWVITNSVERLPNTGPPLSIDQIIKPLYAIVSAFYVFGLPYHRFLLSTACEVGCTRTIEHKKTATAALDAQSPFGPAFRRFWSDVRRLAKRVTSWNIVYDVIKVCARPPCSCDHVLAALKLQTVRAHLHRLPRLVFAVSGKHFKHISQSNSFLYKKVSFASSRDISCCIWSYTRFAPSRTITFFFLNLRLHFWNFQCTYFFPSYSASVRGLRFIIFTFSSHCWHVWLQTCASDSLATYGAIEMCFDWLIDWLIDVWIKWISDAFIYLFISFVYSSRIAALTSLRFLF